MISFKQFLNEDPFLFSAFDQTGKEFNENMSSNGYLNKPLNGLIHRGPNQVLTRLKPKKIGKIGDNYALHHAQIQDKPIFGSPIMNHHVFLTKDNKVVGYMRGERIRAEKVEGSKKPIEHIGIGLAVIHPKHRGQNLYARMMQEFVSKTPHVLYSDTAQTKGSAKAWSHLSRTSEESAIDFRLHPLIHGSDNIVGQGISRSGEIDPMAWTGTRLPAMGGKPESWLPAEKIRFSVRKKS